MTEVFRLTARDLAEFLERHLPRIREDWWVHQVYYRLTFHQRGYVEDNDLSRLQELDLQSLVRILDQNWTELARLGVVEFSGREMVSELRSIRNRWAHAPAEGIPPGDRLEDAERIRKMLGSLCGSPELMEAIEDVQDEARGKREEKIDDEGDTAPERSTNGMSPSSRFSPGDLVHLKAEPDKRGPVMGLAELDVGEPRYTVFIDGNPSDYYESQLEPERVEDARRVLTADQLSAAISSLQILSPSTSNLYSLRSGRIDYVPYQYRPVLKLLRADRPRLLIADEVGVGKTIEAGLILKELQARMDLESVIVLCPKPLVAGKKWYAEMRRFDEHFTQFDRRLLRHCIQETHLEGQWPIQYAKAIVPFSAFDGDLLLGRTKGRRGRGEVPLLELDPPPRFDLVIVDEAHHIRNRETFLHQAVRYFCDHAAAVLFLTATPVQLGSGDLHTLLNVLRPDVVIDAASFENMAAPNPSINRAVAAARRAGQGWANEARTALEDAVATDWGKLFMAGTTELQATYDGLSEGGISDERRVELIRSMEELYTFSSMINRTRRRDIGEFTIRKSETVSVEFTARQRELHDGVLRLVEEILSWSHGTQNVRFMMTMIRRQAASCIYGLAPAINDLLTGKINELELEAEGEVDLAVGEELIDRLRPEAVNLVRMAEALEEDDPKLNAFLRVVRQKQQRENNKVLVFSTFRHTLGYLQGHLGTTEIRIGLIHGSIPDDERLDLRRRFALPRSVPESIDVLLSSEVGCEGLDFQFCDTLANYDLPWNPMKIEQRIGRIDRYGQKAEAVRIVNLITPGTVDADIYERCLWRIGVFESAIGGSEEILGDITREIRELGESVTLSEEERREKLQQIADNGIRRVREERELEEREAEFFGLNLPKRSWEEDVSTADSFWLGPDGLERAVVSYLSDRLGGEQDYLLGKGPTKTLRLSQEARNVLLEDYRKIPRALGLVPRAWERWLKGTTPTLQVTFDQAALDESPGLALLGLTHPLVRQAAEFFSSTEKRYVSLRTRMPGVPRGVHLFAIYRWRKSGIKSDEMLLPVAEDSELESNLLGLVRASVDGEPGAIPEQDAFDELDRKHYRKWTSERADHSDENRRLIGYRLQSLQVSHNARRLAIEDQIARSTNDRIRRMKESEMARAEADYERRVGELERAAESADIQAAPAFFGVVEIVE
jgi:ATP-dependent helicase HepA